MSTALRFRREIGNNWKQQTQQKQQQQQQQNNIVDVKLKK